MQTLFDQIRAALAEDRYVISNHADDRLRERGIFVWQVIAATFEAARLAERLDAHPNPVVELEGRLPDGTRVKLVWAWLPYNQHAKLVTAHYLD